MKIDLSVPVRVRVSNTHVFAHDQEVALAVTSLGLSLVSMPCVSRQACDPPARCPLGVASSSSGSRFLLANINVHPLLANTVVARLPCSVAPTLPRKPARESIHRVAQPALPTTGLPQFFAAVLFRLPATPRYHGCPRAAGGVNPAWLVASPTACPPPPFFCLSPRPGLVSAAREP